MIKLNKFVAPKKVLKIKLALSILLGLILSATVLLVSVSHKNMSVAMGLQSENISSNIFTDTSVQNGYIVELLNSTTTYSDKVVTNFDSKSINYQSQVDAFLLQNPDKGYVFDDLLDGERVDQYDYYGNLTTESEFAIYAPNTYSKRIILTTTFSATGLDVKRTSQFLGIGARTEVSYNFNLLQWVVNSTASSDTTIEYVSADAKVAIADDIGTKRIMNEILQNDNNLKSGKEPISESMGKGTHNANNRGYVTISGVLNVGIHFDDGFGTSHERFSFANIVVSEQPN